MKIKLLVQRGFTLIELVAGIAILVLIIGFVLELTLSCSDYIFRDGQKRQELESCKFANDLMWTAPQISLETKTEENHWILLLSSGERVELKKGEDPPLAFNISAVAWFERTHPEDEKWFQTGGSLAFRILMLEGQAAKLITIQPSEIAQIHQLGKRVQDLLPLVKIDKNLRQDEEIVGEWPEGRNPIFVLDLVGENIWQPRVTTR